ncbi:hypothetical protein EWM64_g8862 [Hericium alpestre]|uniref:Uncharacterized protein n=1 Tax=Hericium alpestre TaxID=135208 RepID=A0A4Y9ZLL4_9AGAM|nr:hypothetical protein EWM64_g8862 [Hericium alpestre]
MPAAVDLLTAFGINSDASPHDEIQQNLSFGDLLAMAAEYQKDHIQESSDDLALAPLKARPSAMSLQNLLSPLLSDASSASPRPTNSPDTSGSLSRAPSMGNERNLPSLSSILAHDPSLPSESPKRVSLPSRSFSDPTPTRAGAPSVILPPSSHFSIPLYPAHEPSDIAPAQTQAPTTPFSGGNDTNAFSNVFGWKPPAGYTTYPVEVPGAHAWRHDHNQHKETNAALAEAQHIQDMLAPLHTSASAPSQPPQPVQPVQRSSSKSTQRSRAIPAARKDAAAYRSVYGAPMGGIPPSLAFTIVRASFLDVEKERQHIAAQRAQANSAASSGGFQGDYSVSKRRRDAEDEAIDDVLDKRARV